MGRSGGAKTFFGFEITIWDFWGLDFLHLGLLDFFG